MYPVFRYGAIFRVTKRVTDAIEMADYLTRKDGIWIYVRRLPPGLVALERRKFVKQSTGIRVADDPRKIRARQAAARINALTEDYWRGLIDGTSPQSKQRYEAARHRARLMRLSYVPAEQIADTHFPLDELLSRLSLIERKNLIDSEPEVTAVLGGEAPPSLRLSDLFSEFKAISELSLKGLSPDQLKKWSNPKKRALDNLISVAGDKPLTDLTREDAILFVEWWENRIKKENLAVDTANKDIGHLSKMLRIVERRKRIGIKPVFSELRIEGKETNQRIAWLPPFIQTHLLANGAFDDLNEEARRMIYLITETGLRLSEAANLTAATIHLDAEILHISVRSEGRRLKTPQSERDIPLVGVALAAMKLQPDGFPRYRDKGSNFSALVNKYLKGKKLTPEG